MNNMLNKGWFVYLSMLSSVVAVVLAGCVTTGRYKAVPNLSVLEITFEDNAWDGKRVPKGQQCNRDNGEGATPSIAVANLPDGVNAVILEFSDASVAHMNHGGHGKIGYRLQEETSRVTIPSVPGHTFDLPDRFFLVSGHANPAWDTAGAYLPPCSGGKGNHYYLTVKAVYDAPKGEQSKLLGKGKLQMGVY